MPDDTPARPDHDDFWLICEVLQDLDAAAEDVGIERAAPVVDMDSLIYSAMQRALRIMRFNGQADQTLMTQFTACWIDAFVVGLNFQKRRQEKLL